MTASTVNTPTTSFSGRPGRPAQWALMARMLTADALRSLLSATGVMLLILVVGALIARWQGWELVEMTEADAIRLEVVADGDGVTIIASLFILPAAVAITSVVMAIILAARTRVYVAAGATRRAVAIGHLMTALVATAYTLLVTAVVLLVVGRGFDGALELLQADRAGDVAVLTLRAVGAVLLAVMAASAITVVFLRWQWWVGVGLLVLLFTVLPVFFVFLLPSVAEVLDAASTWWGWDLACAVLATGAYWWIIRRVPVR